MTPAGQPTIVPLNDPGRLVAAMADALRAAAARVMERGRFILGPEVAAFEAEFAGYVGAAHGIGVGNGTDALEIALRACGTEAGDGVLTCANAGMYAASAARAIGAIPVFADIDAAGLVDVSTLDAAFASAPAPPRALVATHLYGRMADMSSIMAWARQRGVRVVEDCAQAHGARDGERIAGGFGDAAAFSFYPTKNLGALGDAGMVVSNDDAIAAHARALREYGWTARYRADRRHGRNSRLDELQAAFLREMLPMLDRRNARRRAIAAGYSARIRHPAIQVPPPPGEGDAVHLFVVRSADRDGLAAHLASAGIGSGIHYPIPDHRQPAMAPVPAGTALPATDAWCASVLTLPCFAELDASETDAVVAACNAWAP